MTEGDRPLPTPPRSRFGRDPAESGAGAPGMISDRMALAAAEGRLEEFLQRELPEGDHARTLAMMMMGMSGMVPGGPPAGAPVPPSAASPGVPATDASATPSPEVPPAVLAAIRQGDVANLMGLLRAEHAKRSGDPDPAAAPHAVVSPAPTPADPATPPDAAGRAGIDAAIVDELLRIGRENDVSVDWLMLRAIKLYVEEHRRTGRL